jgi:hypothetical protein
MPGADVRYSAAYNELCTRLSIRNRTLLHFTAFSSGIMAFAMQGDADSSIIGVTIPYIALFVVLISTYHERTIYKLTAYQSRLLDVDKDGHANWMSNDFYGSLGSARIMRDWAQLYILLPISLGALLLIYVRWNQLSDQYRGSYLVASIVSCLCLILTTVVLGLNIYNKRRYAREKALAS